MSAQKLQSVTRSLKHRQPSSFRKQRARPAQQADTQPISLFLLLFLNSSTICQVTCTSTHVGGKIVWSRAFFRHDILFDRTKLRGREVEPSSYLWEFIESTFITRQNPIWFTCMRRLHATINRSFFLLGKTVLSFFFFCFFPFLSTNTRIHVGDLPVLCRLNFYRLSIFSVTSSIFEILSPSRILVHAFSPNFENSQSPLFLPDAVMISRDSTHTSKI